MEKYFQVTITVRYGEVLKRELRSLYYNNRKFPPNMFCYLLNIVLKI